MNLNEDDYQNLRNSFITPEIAESAKLRRVNDEEGAEIVGQKRIADRYFDGIAFPYFLPPNYDFPHSYNLRRDFPDIERDSVEEKEVRKYMKAPGAKSSLYFPPKVTSNMLSDISLPLVICEGEKKILALYRLATYGLKPGERWRFLPVGISGVFNWRGKIGKTTRSNGTTSDVKGLITDFQILDLTHRHTIILFDANVQTNPNVKIARYQCAETLQDQKNAIVFFVDLAQIEGINGIDDLLGLWERENGANEAVKKGLNLLDNKYIFTGELQAILFDGGLKLGIEAAERGKCKVTATDKNDEPLAIDSFNLSEAEKRNKFVKQIEMVLKLTPEQKTEISRELLKLANLSDSLFEAGKAEATATGETVETSFQILKDGRIIEQVRTGFAVYDANTNDYCILETVTDSDGVTYVPVEDELFQKPGGIQLADALTEFGTEAELIADIENYLSRYLDLKPLHLKLTALYILFTFMFDLVLELSYLNATGDPGSGKSRFGQTVCIAAHRGLALITPSAASLFRIVDKFKPTLFIDEFNSNANSDDAAAIIQILNAGFQRTAQIPRQVPTAEGKYKTEMFDAFCPKIIGSLKQSGSNAFNSRCVEIQMERTTRNDIPLRLSAKLLKDAQELQNKLTLWRLRNFQTDFEVKLDRSEKELRQAGIMPRSIQINIPLYALMNDDNLKRDFIQLLKGRDEILHEEKRHTIDGEIVQMLHAILFEVGEGGEADWKITRPEENELCEDLRIEKIVSMLNNTNDRKDKPKDHLGERYIGKKIAELGLKSKQILRRASGYHKKSAIRFESHRLTVIFRNYGLPVPADLPSDQSDQNDKTNESDNLTRSDEKLTDNQTELPLDQVKSNNYNDKSDWSDWSKEFSENDCPKTIEIHPNLNKTEKVLVDEVF